MERPAEGPARRLGSTSRGPSDEPADTPRSGRRRLIELSHQIHHGMITYPGLPGPEISDYFPREASPARYGPGTESHIGRISMVVNTGTYLDSPSHRFAGATDVAGLPLQSVADLDGVVVRMDAGRRAIDRDALASYDVRGRAVLVHTGWERYWGTERYGTGNPFLTAAATSGGSMLTDTNRVYATARRKTLSLDATIRYGWRHRHACGPRGCPCCVPGW